MTPFYNALYKADTVNVIQELKDDLCRIWSLLVTRANPCSRLTGFSSHDSIDLCTMFCHINVKISW